ncbi:pyridoxal phosphate-dependent aminotransferase [Bordetella avium]|uniref:Probable aminotransferase n=1 Tax=Bordetella avium (strain 197N) TaxID=360910 RepID=Q2KW87_BORA1|nr:pyridoxal phosphate-dependent aminotransferase [Bordetella avium]AZY51764.1 pyridoxal phosphate-dependent aminotransferase [Bordetella avium]RIQ15999.1 pyridoxal phosphate-dependent aminotransferase [Bordetella avium]RIQ30220.1 pyridoxal phosphate-dependent aminotransferase [Bordetella avium]RIQ48023.1 pyridoxal phosphate-dependent aminotransferase [Bordetella avium]RIQ66514.1 pyridoxal phosphate-dependent aminotransferase [Bordetella avium]
MPRLASRTNDFLTFQVVELFKEAQAMAAAGRDIISLGIGEPDFTAPPQVVEALERAARAGLSGYCAPGGLMPLREAIAEFYATEFGARFNPERVIVTAGASGALALACAALVNPGSEVLMPDPSYPANSNFILAAGGRPKLVPSYAAKRFQLSAQDVRDNWGPSTQGVLIASPSNPTGTSIGHEELKELLAAVRERQGYTIMDEIYLGLSYEQAPRSALTLDDDLIIINSFSKYFHMTGWRLGWMIVPESMIGVLEKMSASLQICAPTLAQHAALACFSPDALKIFAQRRDAFRQRRDYLLPEFERLGIPVPVKPDGAFYIYSDISQLGQDSLTFSKRLLHEAGVAAVPGVDFGPTHGLTTMRFSYATSLDRLQEAVARIGKLL